MASFIKREQNLAMIKNTVNIKIYILSGRQSIADISKDVTWCYFPKYKGMCTELPVAYHFFHPNAGVSPYPLYFLFMSPQAASR